jgi:2-oxoacid:acceptor oxidoreductase delta subunit (pyruvate/2-ketoisovalerate family)
MSEATQTCKRFSISQKDWNKQNQIPDEQTAIELAKECLVNVTCNNCDLCLMFCPDLCITRNKSTGNIEIDYDYCKGCGICAYICPKNVIHMERETT